MTYYDGYVIPVPHAKKDAYKRMAELAAPIFMDHGATEVVECWGDDVSRGEVTDFYRAVNAVEGETVVFSWVAWPDKATRDAAHPKVMADPRFEEMGPNDVFDGKRLVLAGFSSLIDEGSPGRPGFIEAFLIPIAEGKQQELVAFESRSVPIMLDLGCTRLVEAWGDDLPHGEVTDFYRAVAAEEGETVVFAWMEYPDKAARDAANEKMMSDPRFADMGEPPFNGKRMIFSGFVPILQV
jgi:uncharacterized protein YbaA (DUF1428 family)